MSKFIKYTGTSDFQEFSKADLERSEGIEEGKKLRFAKDEPVEVSDEIAAVLTGNEDPLFGEHSFEEVSEEEAAKLKEANEKKSKTKAPEAGDADSQTATGSLALGTGGSQSGQGTGPAGRQGSLGAGTPAGS